MKRQDVNVQVVNVISPQQRFSFLGLLMLIGLVMWLWKFFLLVAILTIIVVICASVYRKTQRDREAILQRADQQHQWAMQGDPRGTYGRDWNDIHAEEIKVMPAASRHGHGTDMFRSHLSSGMRIHGEDVIEVWGSKSRCPRCGASGWCSAGCPGI